ncbi:MAG: chorismate synthase, partial [Deltaproteobacteria bacterium]
MTMLRYLTSGESHGKQLCAIIEGIPSGLSVNPSDINEDLSRRQLGYGRGARMLIEKDRVEIISGVRHGHTTGAPIGLLIPNRDWENWKEVMAVEAGPFSGPDRRVTEPRPGHADLSAGLKYNYGDLRDALERSSARETAARVAVGAISKVFLKEFGINIVSWVTQINGVKWCPQGVVSPLKLFKMAENSDVRCPDKKASSGMRRAIDKARENGDSAGGVFEVVAFGVPPGLGSHIQWDKKLDGRMARALMSIQAIKGVEVGLGFKAAELPGSKVHDEIFY